MEIRPLDKRTYAGQTFTARYHTNGYYDICPDEHGFQVQYKPFDAPVERSLGSPETWNNRFRISNICIFDDSRRGKGLGARLLAPMLDAARTSGARMLILETQSCNENAIAFYRRNGFDIVGFDLYAYSNTDPDRHEVRIEMGRKLG